MSRHDRLMRSALWLAGQGMSVFPLRPGRKTPALSHGWEDRATTDVAQIERWWMTAPYNIGVATGPSHLLVVDLDSSTSHGSTGDLRDGRQELNDLARSVGAVVPRDTFAVATAGGGLHLYFRAADEALGNTAGRLGRRVDTRARGGYVVGPGSTVGGRSYRVVCTSVPADPPGWMVAALRPVRSAPHPAPPTGRHRHAYVDAAVAGEARNVDDAPVGRRNHVLYVAAARLARFVANGQLSTHDVRAALGAAAARHVGVEGFTSREMQRTIESGLRRAASTPSGRLSAVPSQRRSLHR